MTRPSDTLRDPVELAAIRRHARNALEAAGAMGRYPTPVADILEVAKLCLVEEDALTEGFLARLRKKALKAGDALKSALTKVRGLFDVRAGIIYIDRTVKKVKQTFLKLHESGHGVLAWQRELYGIVEDCEKTISPEVSEQFDREANAFASEVLFQLDDFSKLAADERFGINVPMRLSKKYGASVYASVRRYVSTHHCACAVLVMDPPVIVPGKGFVSTLRRVEVSAEFRNRFGDVEWPAELSPDDLLGAAIPVGGRKMSRPRLCPIPDRNGLRHECMVEAFTSTYQVFLLIHHVATLTRRIFLMPTSP